MRKSFRKTKWLEDFVCAGALAACLAVPAWAQGTAAGSRSPSGPPPSSAGIFPLDQIKRGMMATAWTVFEGTKPEPMQVEILGVLHGARGPKHDLILARLRGEKPEYTGVVAGMSGSPVYIDGKLAGALSYRIGQFSKEPIAGITPIAQMLEVRDAEDKDLADGKIEQASLTAPKLTAPKITPSGGVAGAAASENFTAPGSFTAIETPLTMSGFGPEAIRLWKDKMAGTGLDAIAAGGQAGSTDADLGPVMPGSAVSLQLMRGDLEMAATCTVTYLDAKHLLACGHPVMQNGAVSLPMTATEVVATLASPLNAFKIVNTGQEIGAFTEDRDAAIGGMLGLKARMIPMTVEIAGSGPAATDHVELLDHPALTGSAVLVSVYQMLMQSNRGGAETSYHVTGEIALHGMAPVAVDAWGVPNEQMAPPLMAALSVGNAFNQLYANASRQTPVESVRLKVEALPENMRAQLESVRLISSSIVHPGGRVEVEATVRPWQQPVHNVRLSFEVPASVAPGMLRLLVSGSTTVDRTLDAARPPAAAMDLAGAAARLRDQHAADQVYVSVLLPAAQASVDGRTLESLPLSVANTMEPERSGVDAAVHGESLVVAAQAAAGGVLTGQQLLSVRVEAGGGLD